MKRNINLMLFARLSDFITLQWVRLFRDHGKTSRSYMHTKNCYIAYLIRRSWPFSKNDMKCNNKIVSYIVYASYVSVYVFIILRHCWECFIYRYSHIRETTHGQTVLKQQIFWILMTALSLFTFIVKSKIGGENINRWL